VITAFTWAAATLYRAGVHDVDIAVMCHKPDLFMRTNGPCALGTCGRVVCVTSSISDAKAIACWGLPTFLTPWNADSPNGHAVRLRYFHAAVLGEHVFEMLGRPWQWLAQQGPELKDLVLVAPFPEESATRLLSMGWEIASRERMGDRDIFHCMRDGE